MKCQINKNTIKINDNTRFILGRSAYHVTGLADFLEEFTFDDDSIHIMTFTIRREEPQENDDMVKKVADGKLFSYSFANIPFLLSLRVGEPMQLEPMLKLNGETVKPSEEFPQTWIYTNNSPSNISISDDGVIEAIRNAAFARFSVTLKENPNIHRDVICNISTPVGDKY